MIKVLKSTMILLKFNRVWIDGEDSFKILTFVLHSLNYLIQIFMVYAVLKKLYETRDDLIVVTFCIWSISLNGPCIGKYYGLIRYRQNIKNILNKLEFELLHEFKIDKDEILHIKHAENLISKYLKKYILMTFISCIPVISVPLWKKIFSYYGLFPKNAFVGFPFPAWSPFGEVSYIGYAFEYIAHCYFLYSLWACWLGGDVLFAGVIFHLCGHLKIIQGRIEKWKYCSNLRLSEVNVNKRDLRRIILYHVEVLRIGKILNEALNLANLLQLFFISIIICCCGIQVITSCKEEVNQIFMMFFIMMCMTTSWLLVCFVENQISTETEKIGEIIYSINWMDLEYKQKKNFCFIIHRAQKPLVMTCGKFFKISLSLFLDMAKMSYSLLAVLRTMYH